MANKFVHTKAEVVSKEDEGIVEAVVGSTSVIDRMGDSIDQEGWDLKNFKKNPVILWGHNLGEERPPIGKAVKVWLDGAGKKAKLMFKVQFDMADEFAAEIFRKVKEGFVNTVSVGFLPTEWERIDVNNPFSGFKYLKQELLELSFVPVPANQEALVSLRSMGVEPIEDLKSIYPEIKDLNSIAKNSLDVKPENTGALPYIDLGMLPESEDWDAPGEVAKCGSDFEKLKEISAWSLEDKAALPHHDAETKKANWRGVATAMATLMGAKGGVDIPEADRKGVYDHLAEHYKQFNKTVPSYQFVEDQILACFDEEIHALTLDREEKHVVRLIKKVLKLLADERKDRGGDASAKEPTQEEVVLALQVVNQAVSKLNLKGGE